LDDLLTEQPHPDSQNIDTLPTAGILAVLNAADLARLFLRAEVAARETR
jgi:N-acetylmuramic acid 6-phosphate (MurNAc-6-P) etherase